MSDVVMLSRGTRLSTKKVLTMWAVTMRKISHCPSCGMTHPETEYSLTDCCDKPLCAGSEMTFAYGGERVKACCRGVASVLLDGPGSEVK